MALDTLRCSKKKKKEYEQLSPCRKLYCIRASYSREHRKFSSLELFNYEFPYVKLNFSWSRMHYLVFTKVRLPYLLDLIRNVWNHRRKK